MDTSTRPFPPHVAERRALRHLVVHELTEPELRAAALAGRPDAPAAAPGWRELAHTLQEPTVRSARVLVTGPEALTASVIDVLRPLAGHVTGWDGSTATTAPDLLVAALPWRLDSLWDAMNDLPGLPGAFAGRPPAVLPLAFTQRSVTVGPIAGLADVGPCLQCVRPALSEATSRPETSVAPALNAFASGAGGLFVRAMSTRSGAATSMSLTFDVAAPHVEHRLWACTPGCRSAA